MVNGRILLVDCGIERKGKTLQLSRYGDITLMQFARKRGIPVDRFPLLDHPKMDKEDIHRLLEKYDGVIVNGSALINGSDDKDRLTPRLTSGSLNTTVLRIIQECVQQGMPLLGICYGGQMIGRFAGENIVKLPHYEFGFVEIELTGHGQFHPLFSGLPRKLLVAQYHGWGIENDKARYLDVLAKNDLCIQAFTIPGTSVIGVQFHTDFHDDVDGKGTGAMAYYCKDTGDLRLEQLSLIIEPENLKLVYGINVTPLARFIDLIHH